MFTHAHLGAEEGGWRRRRSNWQGQTGEGVINGGGSRRSHSRAAVAGADLPTISSSVGQRSHALAAVAGGDLPRGVQEQRKEGSRPASMCSRLLRMGTQLWWMEMGHGVGTRDSVGVAGQVGVRVNWRE